MKNTEPGPEAVYAAALRLLTARDVTVSGMRSRLERRGFRLQDVEGAVERLQAEGFLNDRRYAERFAGSAAAAGKFVGPRLRLEMRRRGFPADIIADVLAGQDADEQLQTLRSLVEHRFPQIFDGRPPLPLIRKALSF